MRSILLLVKNPRQLSAANALRQVRNVAADSASLSSVAYARILFEHFHDTRPNFVEQPADPLAMLASADAALLIGDPALLAREHRAQIEAAIVAPLLWLDLAELWRERTGLQMCIRDRCFSSTPMSFLGRSMMWPMEASTT